MWEEQDEHPARIGWVALVREPGEADKWYYGSEIISDETLAFFVKKKQYIGQLELLAAVIPYYSAPALFVGKRVIHYIDNTSALAGLTKGYSSRVDSAFIVHSFHGYNAGLQAVVWFEWVASKANVADGPSRGDSQYVKEVLGATIVKSKLPPLHSWRAPSEEWCLRGSAQASRR